MRRAALSASNNSLSTPSPWRLCESAKHLGASVLHVRLEIGYDLAHLEALDQRSSFLDIRLIGPYRLKVTRRDVTPYTRARL